MKVSSKCLLYCTFLRKLTFSCFHSTDPDPAPARRTVNDALLNTRRLPAMSTTFPSTMVGVVERWLANDMDSYPATFTGWPRDLKLFATKQRFLMARIRTRAETLGVTVRIAAQRWDQERGRKTPQTIWRELHATTPGITRRAKRGGRGRRRRDDDEEVDPDATPPRTQRRRLNNPPPTRRLPAQQPPPQPVPRQSHGQQRQQRRPNQGRTSVSDEARWAPFSRQMANRRARIEAARNEAPAAMIWQREGYSNGRNFHDVHEDYW